jgi:hypothetical protein
MPRGKTNVRSRKPSALIALMFTASIADHRSARSVPTETMTKAQMKCDILRLVTNPASDGFDTGVEVSW